MSIHSRLARRALLLVPLLVAPLLLTSPWLGAASTAAAPAADPARLASGLQASEARVAALGERLAALEAAPAPAAPMDALRQDLLTETAGFAYREAVRDEQADIYALAIDPGLQAAVLSRLPPGAMAGVTDAAGGLRALWRLAGISDLSLVRIHHSRLYRAAEPVGSLDGYYRSAQARYGVDWTILAAINYIESDFGRTDGPSSAGALGPMQFLPSTWRAYGSGDVMDPHDAILGAAHYLRRMGAASDLDTAILRYNDDGDYLQAVKSFAAAMSADGRWLNRLYYWSTYG